MPNDITAIWAAFHKELRGFILNKTRNPADADDVLQDVFVKIIRNMDKVNRTKNIRPYLYGIVRNAVHDYFRSKRHQNDEIENPEDFSEEETSSLNESIAECCLKPFINKLPGRYREALLIAELQNVPQKEMAKQLHISYSGAKSRVQRGKKMLKELILNCCSYQSDAYGNLIDQDEEQCGCA